LVPKSLVPKSLVPKSLVPKSLVPTSLIPTAPAPRALIAALEILVARIGAAAAIVAGTPVAEAASGNVAVVVPAPGFVPSLSIGLPIRGAILVVSSVAIVVGHGVHPLPNEKGAA
jgi:hypothetical protein